MSSRNTTPAPTGDLWRAFHFIEEARRGRMLPLVALDAVEAELELFQERMRKLMAAKDDEVVGNREGRVHRNPSETSAKAASLVAPRTGTQRARILEAICSMPGGVTDYELESRLRMLGNSVRPRRSELVEAGYVADSGRTRKHRRTEWSVWVPTQAGLDWFSRQQASDKAA